MYTALPVEDDNMVDNDYSPLSLKEKWLEDASGRPCNWRKGIWWVGTALYFLGSWGLLDRLCHQSYALPSEFQCVGLTFIHPVLAIKPHRRTIRR
jgi:hypothetical protein